MRSAAAAIGRPWTGPTRRSARSAPTSSTQTTKVAIQVKAIASHSTLTPTSTGHGGGAIAPMAPRSQVPAPSSRAVCSARPLPSPLPTAPARSTNAGSTIDWRQDARGSPGSAPPVSCTRKATTAASSVASATQPPAPRMAGSQSAPAMASAGTPASRTTATIMAASATIGPIHRASGRTSGASACSLPPVVKSTSAATGTSSPSPASTSAATSPAPVSSVSPGRAAAVTAAIVASPAARCMQRSRTIVPGLFHRRSGWWCSHARPSGSPSCSQGLTSRVSSRSRTRVARKSTSTTSAARTAPSATVMAGQSRSPTSPCAASTSASTR